MVPLSTSDTRTNTHTYTIDWTPDTLTWSIDGNSMRTLNRAAAEAAARLPADAVHACTDITGFGLIGHASEVAAASAATLAIDAGKVPVFPGVLELTARNRSGGMGSNEEHFGKAVQADPAIERVVPPPGGVVLTPGPHRLGRPGEPVAQEQAASRVRVTSRAPRTTCSIRPRH